MLASVGAILGIPIYTPESATLNISLPMLTAKEGTENTGPWGNKDNTPEDPKRLASFWSLLLA
jgi:hypothetical protein